MKRQSILILATVVLSVVISFSSRVLANEEVRNSVTGQIPVYEGSELVGYRPKGQPGTAIGGMFVSPGERLSRPPAPPAPVAMTPEVALQQRLKMGQQQIQDRFAMQWEEINRSARFLGPAKHREMLLKLDTAARKEMFEFTQKVQARLVTLQQLNEMARQGLDIPNIDRIKMEMAFGKDVADAMYPERPSVERQYGTVDIYARRIESDLDQFRMKDEKGKRISPWKIARYGQSSFKKEADLLTSESRPFVDDSVMIFMITIFFSFILTWGIGLMPPLLIRYVIVRRPLGKKAAIPIVIVLWLMNLVIFTALGSQSKTHAALFFVAWASYYIMHRRYAIWRKEGIQTNAGENLTPNDKDDGTIKSASNAEHADNNNHKVMPTPITAYTEKELDKAARQGKNKEEETVGIQTHNQKNYVHTPAWLIVLAVILCISGVTSFTSVVYKTTLDPLRQISFGFLIWQFLRLFRGSVGVSIFVGVLGKKKWTIKTVVVYAITSCLCSAIYATRSLLTEVMASDVPITFPYYMPIVFAFLVVGVFLPGIVVFLFFRKSARAALARSSVSKKVKTVR